MSKKIISILIALVFVLGLISCTKTDKKPGTLPPVTTVGLPQGEELSTSYESEGFAVSIYETYSEITAYKGEDTEIAVPDAFMGIPVKSIAEYAFFGNATITKITLPDSLLVIGKSAFQDCTALTEVVLGSNLEHISQAAFRDSALERINLPDTVAEIDRYAFYRTRITEIKLPSSLSSVQKYVFYGCERLSKVDFCPRIERIAEYAFSACSSLSEVVIPDRTEIISDYAFSECTSLTKIFVPKKTGFGDNPFHASNEVTIYSPSKSKAQELAKKYGYSYEACASANKMP